MNKDTRVELTEERVREIVREEVNTMLRGITQARLAEFISALQEGLASIHPIFRPNRLQYS